MAGNAEHPLIPNCFMKYELRQINNRNRGKYAMKMKIWKPLTEAINRDIG